MTISPDAKPLIRFVGYMSGLWTSITVGVGLFVSGFAALLLSAAFTTTALLIGATSALVVRFHAGTDDQPV